MFGKTKRMIAIFLTLVLVIPLLFTGTFAWQSINQQAKNETVGQDTAYFDVELLKLERSPEGEVTEIIVPGAAFYLFTSDGGQIGGRYETDEEGKIEVSLASGDYYFEEIDPGGSHKFDEENGAVKTKYPFTVTGEETAAIQVKAYNQRLTGNLTLEKKILNSGGSEVTEEQAQQDFTFKVTFSDGGTYEYRIDEGESQILRSGGTLVLKHGEKAVFENIPVGTYYEISEENPGAYSVTSEGSSGNITEEGASACFINTLDPGDPGSLTVTKEVRNADGSAVTEEQADQEFTFRVTFNDGGTYTYRTDDGKEQSLESGDTVNLKHGQKAVFSDIPSGIGYEVEEFDREDDDYSPEAGRISGNILEAGSSADFVNICRADTADDTGSLVITKEIVNGDGSDVTQEQKEKEFTFSIAFSKKGEYTYRTDGGEEHNIQSGDSITLKHGQKAVFEELADGLGYTVTETGTGGYVPEIDELSGNISGGTETELYFKNHYLKGSDEKAGRIKITKIIAGEYPEEESNREFDFIISIDGNETGFTLKPGETKEFEAPVGSSYEVTEDNYFDEGYAQSMANGSGYVTNDPEPVTVSAANTYMGNPDTIINGEKSWNLNGKDVEIPESVTVRLKDGKYTVAETEVTPDSEGKWTYSFTAPKYDADGEEIAYTIEEVPVEGFTAAYSGYDIINTYTEGDTPEIDPGDKPEDTEDPDDEETKLSGGSGAKTGDESNIGFWLAFMGLSLAGIGVTLLGMKLEDLKKRFK